MNKKNKSFSDVNHTFYFFPDSITDIATEDIDSIHIFGDFNNWGENKSRLKDYKLFYDKLLLESPKKGSWYRTMTIPHGKHDYKFFITLKDKTNIWFPPGDNLSIITSKVSDWTKHKIYYQIFPDRFWKEGTSCDNYPLSKWNDQPTPYNFFGGNIKGIAKQIENGYFRDLFGEQHLKNVIFYFNPVQLSSASNHGYWIEDYHRVDPLFGTDKEFKQLCDLIHSHGGKVIQDIVFNHSGINHFAFQDILLNGTSSIFYTWYRKIPNLVENKIKLPVLEKTKSSNEDNDELSDRTFKDIQSLISKGEIPLKLSLSDNKTQQPVLEIINDFRSDNYKVDEPTYFSLYEGRFLLPVKNYMTLSPVKRNKAFNIDKNDIDNFNNFCFSLKDIMEDEYDNFIVFNSFSSKKIAFFIDDLLDSFVEHKYKAFSKPYSISSEWNILNLINHYYFSVGQKPKNSLDIVNKFNKLFNRKELKPSEVIESYFNKPISQITTKDILNDQDYYELTVDKVNYSCWWDLFELPQFNTKNHDLRRYLFDSVKYFISLGIDGFRLDVPEVIKNPPNDDNTFWSEFRRNCIRMFMDVRGEKADYIFVIGEIWGNDEINSWIKTYDDGPLMGLPIECDVIMNYSFRKSILDFTSGVEIAEKQDNIKQYPYSILPEELDIEIWSDILSIPKENLDTMFNLLSSHDTRRVLALFQNYKYLDGINKEEQERLEKAYYSALVLQFTVTGNPSIYYGDEIGLTGLENDGYNNSFKDSNAKGTDPLCRGTFPFVKDDLSIIDYMKKNPNSRYSKSFSFYKKLISIYQQNVSLGNGDFFTFITDNDNHVYGFLRITDDNRLLIIVTNGMKKEILHSYNLNIDYLNTYGLPEDKKLTELLTEKTYTIDDDNNLRINLEQYYSAIFSF